MQFGDILITLDGSPSGRARAEAGVALAARSGARAVGYYLPALAELPAESDFSMKTAADVPATEAVDAANAEFERLLRTHSVAGQWMLGDASQAIDELATYARCADLVVAGLGDPDDPKSDPQGIDVERLIVECGRPVLGMPMFNVPDRIGENVMIAWDGSRESARALHDALPFLREAASISIVAIDIDPLSMQSPTNVAQHLGRMGIAAKVDTALALNLPIGEEILSRVDWEHIDLLVAGAFGHPRVWEHLFGGPSMTLIHQMMVPVLVSH